MCSASKTRAGERHPGYREEEMAEPDYEQFRPLERPLQLRAPLVVVDTAAPVNLDAVSSSIWEQISRKGGVQRHSGRAAPR